MRRGYPRSYASERRYLIEQFGVAIDKLEQDSCLGVGFGSTLDIDQWLDVLPTDQRMYECRHCPP